MTEANTAGTIGHVVPEARLGGPIALVQDGDRIVIDSEKRTIDWDVGGEEQARRRREWESSGKGALTVKRGILLRYARDVAVSGLCSVTCIKIFWLRMRLPYRIARRCGSIL
jgi:dihydroxy-acid dehydratase